MAQGLQVDPSLEKGAELLDALCYIDHDIEDPGLRGEVERLIEEEMKRFRPRDYLASRPMPTVNFEKSLFVAKEMERLAAEKPMEKVENRVTASKPPQELQGDLQAWRGSLRSARVAEEYVTDGLLNLELLQNYAPDVWLMYNTELEKSKARISQELDRLKKQAEAVNLNRKSDQDGIHHQVYNLKRKYDETLLRNLETHKACAILTTEIKQLRREAAELGVVLAGEEGAAVNGDDMEES